MSSTEEAAGAGMWREAGLFVLQTVLLSCLLGVAVDLVTAHVAVEYFTVHHPRVVDSESPWVMALVWGVGASWWFGLLAALPLWWVNLRRPVPLSRRRVLQMVAWAGGVIWLVMMTILGGVYLLAEMVPEGRRTASFESDRRLMAVAMAHQFEYVLGGIVVVILLLRIRLLRPCLPSSRCPE